MKPSSLRLLSVLILLTAGYCTTPPPRGPQLSPAATLAAPQATPPAPAASPTSPAVEVSTDLLKATPATAATETPAASSSPSTALTPAASLQPASLGGGEATPSPGAGTGPETNAQNGAGTTPAPGQPGGTPENNPVSASSSSSGGEACVEKVAFVADVTIPDNTMIRQGESFTKTWRLRNVGTCAWRDGYQLVFAGGDPLNGPLSGPALPTAGPGDYLNVSIDLAAPLNGGVYTGNWEFQNPAGQRFGVGMNARDPIWASIQVNWIGPQESGSSSGANTGASGETTLVSTGGEPGSEAPSGGNACPATGNPGYLDLVLQLVNQARAEIGLLPLILQPQLTAAAQAHSLDMACNDYVDHVGTDGSSWNDRVRQEGYQYKSTAWENIYVGNPAFGGTPQGAMAWWMNSKVHRENILNPYAFEVGVGYAYNPNSTYGGYYTLVFSSPADQP